MLKWTKGREKEKVICTLNNFQIINVFPPIMTNNHYGLSSNDVTLYSESYLPFIIIMVKKITKETRIEKNKDFMVLSWGKKAIPFVVYPMFMLRLTRKTNFDTILCLRQKFSYLFVRFSLKFLLNFIYY